MKYYVNLPTLLVKIQKHLFLSYKYSSYEHYYMVMDIPLNPALGKESTVNKKKKEKLDDKVVVI